MKQQKATKNLQFKIKEFNAETGYVSGYAAVFNTQDWNGDIIAPNAFDNCLDMHKAQGTNMKIYWCHDQSDCIGVWNKATVDSVGLFLEGQLTLKVQKAQEVLALISAGAVDGISIGYFVIEEHYDSKAKSRVLDKIYAFEASFVPVPAHPSARLYEAKSALQEGNIPTEREMEKLLRDVGLSQKRAKAFLAQGYKGLSMDTTSAEEAEASAETAPPAEENALPQNINTNDEVEQETNSESLNETPLPAPFESAEVKNALSHLLTLF